MTQNIHTVEQAFRLARNYLKKGNVDEAERLYTMVVAKFPQNKKAKKMLKTVQNSKNKIPGPAPQEISLLVGFYSTGKLNEALEYALGLFKKYPDNARLNLSLGAVQADLGMIDDAILSYKRCLGIDPNYADAHNNLGNVFKDLTLYDEAIKCFRRSLELVPADVEVLCNLGNVFLEIGDWNNATIVFRQAIDIQPDCAEAYVSLGFAMFELGNIEKANAFMKCGRDLRSLSVDTHFVLCSFYEKNNQIEDLREVIAEAKVLCKGNLDKLAIAEAALLQFDGDLQGALVLVESVSGFSEINSFQQTRSMFSGKLHDRLGNFSDAFRSFEDGNRRSKVYATTNGIVAKNVLLNIEKLEKCFSPEWVSSWQRVDFDKKRVDPVFLVGFPRSGTTLLDTILRSHHSISVVEEGPMVFELMAEFRSLPGGYPNAIAELGVDQIEMLRQVYFSELDKHLDSVERNKPIVVDKLPLNCNHAGLLHRIFPDAKFIFAQRHPCDCVLSCFMQNFELNAAMANFLELEDAAVFYDRVMNLWQQYQVLLPLESHTVVYEDVVGSFETTLRPLFEFLDLEWDENVKNYSATALGRARIRTPSYNQVTQPLYKHASGRWENYREQMSPILPLLLPWAKRMGYDEQKFQV
jgi:Tfp pilus assembly protein PilF